MIAKYAVRSLLKQRALTLVTVIVIASTTSAITVLCGAVNGLRRSVYEKGRTDTAVVLMAGADGEQRSRIKTPINAIKVLPHVAHGPDGELVSPELLTAVPLLRRDGRLERLRLRGVDPVALRVHDHVQVRGRLPQRGEAGIVVGSKKLGLNDDLREGGSIRIGHESFPVIGVLDGGSTGFDSELWCDRTLLQNMLGTTTNSAVFVRLDGPEQQSEFAAEIAKLKGEHVTAVSERELGRRALKDIALYFDAIGLLIVMLAIGAVLAATNTVHAAFLGQLSELAMLMAIGFTRRRVALIMAAQTLVLAGAGAALGLGIAIAASGHRMTITQNGPTLTYLIEIGLPVVVVGVSNAVAIGLLSSLFANIQIWKVNVLSALRT